MLPFLIWLMMPVNAEAISSSGIWNGAWMCQGVSLAAFHEDGNTEEINSGYICRMSWSNVRYSPDK